MAEPPPPPPPGPILIEGSDHDAALSKSRLLSRAEVASRRARRAKQLARIYRDHYWALMEELKLRFRDYYWDFGVSPFLDDQTQNDRINPNNNNEDNSNAGAVAVAGNNNNSNSCGSGRCGVHGCKAKAMALTRFCHMHILSDAKQSLYKACAFSIKSSTTGPILCGKPILRSTVPSYCPLHFQKAEKHMVRALKKVGLNVSSTSKVAPKLHVVVAEYVRQIQQKRRLAQKAIMGNGVVIKEENHS